MKDGRTHLAHKAEHAVDLDTGAVVAITVQPADEGDTTTSQETLIEAAEQIERVDADGGGLKELVADKGNHSNQSRGGKIGGKRSLETMTAAERAARAKKASDAAAVARRAKAGRRKG